MNNEQFSRQNDLELNSDESKFNLAGLESYYERQVLKVGQGVVGGMFEVEAKE